MQFFSMKIPTILKKTRIQFILSLSFTCVSVVGLLGFGTALFLRFTYTTNKMAQEHGEHLLSQVNLILEMYLKDCMDVSDTLYYRVIKKTDFATDNIHNELQLLYESNKDSLISIALFLEDGSVVSAAPLSQLKVSATPQEETWFQSAMAEGDLFHFSQPHVQNLFYNSSDHYDWVISLSRRVELLHEGTLKEGVLLLDLSFDGMEKLCQGFYMPSSSYIYLMDASGELIFHPVLPQINSGIMEENVTTAVTYHDGSHQETFQGQQRQVAVKTVGYTGWKLVRVTPTTNFNAYAEQLQFFFLFTLCFTLFLLIFINHYLSHKISKPIKNLENQVKSIEYGGHFPEILGNSSYEIESLHHAIASMVSTSHHLMNDIITQEKEKRRIELEVLQSQINPHFLYNTLDTVIWMAESGQSKEVVTLVSSLARLFRIALSGGNRFIPLKEELEHAKHYLQIQQVRYKNTFTTDITVDSALETGLCMKLVLQPILENAIYHGVAHSDGEGEIHIEATTSPKEEGVLLLKVTDNGCGMPAEAVENLLSGRYRGKHSRGSGIGFNNVHQRIQLTFGKAYGLSIESEPDEGTQVTLRLPLNPPLEGTLGTSTEPNDTSEGRER